MRSRKCNNSYLNSIDTPRAKAAEILGQDLRNSVFKTASVGAHSCHWCQLKPRRMEFAEP